MSDQVFLLYPLETGEDPVCLSCGTQMTVAPHEARETKPDFIIFRCRTAGALRSLFGKNSRRAVQRPPTEVDAVARYHQETVSPRCRT
jgi:hypothetical protein